MKFIFLAIYMNTYVEITTSCLDSLVMSNAVWVALAVTFTITLILTHAVVDPKLSKDNTIENERANATREPRRIDQKVARGDVKRKDWNNISEVTQASKQEKQEADAIAWLSFKVEKNLGESWSQIEHSAKITENLAK